MLKAYKYRLYPNNEQKEYFAKTFGCGRLIYNLMLADRIKSYEENKDLDIKKIKYPKYTNLQERLEAFYQKPIDEIYVESTQEVDVGAPKGDEYW